MDREIPLSSTNWPIPQFGTGVVKVTPAHDPNDFEAGRRHNLPHVKVIDETRPHDREPPERTPASTASRRAAAWWLTCRRSACSKRSKTTRSASPAASAARPPSSR